MRWCRRPGWIGIIESLAAVCWCCRSDPLERATRVAVRMSRTASSNVARLSLAHGRVVSRSGRLGVRALVCLFAPAPPPPRRGGRGRVRRHADPATDPTFTVLPPRRGPSAHAWRAWWRRHASADHGVGAVREFDLELGDWPGRTTRPGRCWSSRRPCRTLSSATGRGMRRLVETSVCMNSILSACSPERSASNASPLVSVTSATTILVPSWMRRAMAARGHWPPATIATVALYSCGGPAGGQVSSLIAAEFRGRGVPEGEASSSGTAPVNVPLPSPSERRGCPSARTPNGRRTTAKQ